MASKDLKLSLLLNGGLDNRSLPELAQPLVKQGESPKLVASTNTRLSVKPGTCMRAPKFTRIVQFAAGTKRWGIIPSRVGKNAISPGGISSSTYLIPGSGGSLSFTDPGEGASQPPAFGTNQEPFVPARIVAAGALDSVTVDTHVAIGYSPITGIVWRVYSHAKINGITGHLLYVSAWSIDGVELSPPTYIDFVDDSALRWVGVTHHGASGDRLWYTSLSGICYRTLAITSRTVAWGDEVVVVVPGIATTGIDVISDGSTHAYLAHQQSGSLTGATLRRVNVTNGTTTHSVTIAGALAGGGKCGVHYGTLNGVARVAVAFSRVSGAKVTLALYNDTLGVAGAPFELDGYGDVSVGFYEDALYSARKVLLALSITQGNFATIAGTPGFLGTIVYTTDVATWGAGGGVARYPWLIAQSHFVHWQRGVDQFPIFFLGRSYGDTDNDPGGANYVDDPSITAYLWGANTARPVARFGVVRGTLAPAYVAAQACFASRSCFAFGDRFMFAYRKLPRFFGANDRHSTGRFVVVDLAVNQPAIAYDKDGVALFSGAAPAQFDGDVFDEIGGPYHAPKIVIKTAPGVPGLPNGVYRFAVVYEWTDNSGNVHRSRPSNVLTATVSGPTDHLTVFTSTQDGFGAFEFGQTEALFYASEVNGTSLHLFSRVFVTRQSPLQSAGYQAQVDGGNPQIYSTGSAGEEILPQPAPPLRDIVTIGPRAWGIDAELPTRIVFSKLRVAGVGYEFFPAGEVNLPSDAGDGMAVRDWQGLTIILAERGVYQVSGDGPSNNASGGEFSQPIKISDIGCSNTASAISFPGGIIWQSGTRFAMLGPGGADFVPNFDCLYDVTHALLQRRYEEIQFYSSTVAEVRVYNYSVGRWTTWDSQTLEAPVTCAALLPYNEDQAFLYSEATGFMYRLDADSVSPCANMKWEIDWTLLGGDFQDHVILRDVILNGTILGPHSITIEVLVDYEAAPSTTRTWVDATVGDTPGLAAIAKNGRYTVRLEPEEQNARAIKIRVYDTVAVATVDRRGVQPRSLTVVYAIDGMLYEEVFVEGAFK